jgi:hypothetical protein
MDTQTALANFVSAAQALVDNHMSSHCPNNTRKVLSVESGRRYARIVIQSEGDELSRSAYCFVDMTNGNVLKSDGWKKPAKGPRGSIFAPNPVAGVGPYGALYAR